MGNQLVGIAPSEIFPVEHYLTDHTLLQFDTRYGFCKLLRQIAIFVLTLLQSFILAFYSLGSTRFFKVARAKSQEGMLVVKVFAIHDPMLPLTKHRVRVEEIKSKLQSAVNCLCFQKVIVRK